MCAGNGAGLFMSPVDTTKALWSLRYRTFELHHISREEPNGELIRSEVLEHGSIFAELFATLLPTSISSSIKVYNVMDKQPFVWPPSNIGGQIVFIGDLNHAVTPFTGYGANLALMDDWDLADQFCRSNSVYYAITRFNNPAFPVQNERFTFRTL
ncbi:hypothetical protein M433DRAFT_176511 [Acidomyces richmondensis BFW]|nr:MAG: hypothetical protein FE78DRAFT_68260 [Acidomyces sp. 'richmondensis']KYG42724.1 hypothetical protein M433DRAFT_176511 [Acidomyces richmondensis BFW]